MKHTSLHLSVGLVVAIAIASPPGAHGAKLLRTSDGMVCLDGMEREPVTDDAEPILVAADGGCLLAQTVMISI
jgi:hypothetical protein